MPIHYLRGLTGKHRSPEGNLGLARFLAFNAGAVNAGGFLAVGQYTSHMSGIVASISDNLVLGELQLVFGALAALFFFIAGAAASAVLIHWGRRHTHHSEYALPLLAMLRAGQHVIFTADVYRKTRVFARTYLSKFGVEFDIVEPSLAAIERLHDDPDFRVRLEAANARNGVS